MKVHATAVISLLVGLVFTGEIDARDFQMFALDYEGCYDRSRDKSTFVVDSHVHFRPFGGPAIEFDKLLEMILAEEVFFVNAYGIGQKLPVYASYTPSTTA